MTYLCNIFTYKPDTSHRLAAGCLDPCKDTYYILIQSVISFPLWEVSTRSITRTFGSQQWWGLFVCFHPSMIDTSYGWWKRLSLTAGFKERLLSWRKKESSPWLPSDNIHTAHSNDTACCLTADSSQLYCQWWCNDCQDQPWTEILSLTAGGCSSPSYKLTLTTFPHCRQEKTSNDSWNNTS